MNNVTLIGRLTKDPELKYLPNGGKAICRFSLAVDKDLSKDKQQELESQGKHTADFINISAWGKQAENCASFLNKGSMVAIKGRIQTGSYDAEDGSKRYTFEVVAERVEFLGGKSKDSNENTEDGFGEVTNEDIPF